MSSNQDAVFLTELEIDTFQELMNIVFGQAAAELSEVIDIHVILSVPRLRVLKACDLPAFIESNISELTGTPTTIEQTFMGQFGGIGIVVFPADEEKRLLSLFQERDAGLYENISTSELEQEIFLEIGNILIGTCVSKMAELLNDFVIYEPPNIIYSSIIKSDVYARVFDPAKWAFALKTSFHFESMDMSCFLFLITSERSIGPLKISLNNYLKQYE